MYTKQIIINGKCYTEEDIDKYHEKHKDTTIIVDTIKFKMESIKKWKNREIEQSKLFELTNITEDKFINAVSYLTDVIPKWENKRDLDHAEYHKNRINTTKKFIDEINSIPITNQGIDANEAN